MEAVDQEMGVIEDSVASTAAAAADDVAPSASVDVTQVGLGKCGLVMGCTCNGWCVFKRSVLLYFIVPPGAPLERQIQRLMTRFLPKLKPLDHMELVLV